MAPGLIPAQFPFLERLTEAGRGELVALPATRTPPARQLLGRGDPVDGLFLVVGGALRVYYITPEGRQATLYRVEPGQTCVLALAASLGEEPYPAWVEAGARGASFVRVAGAASRRLMHAEPAFRDFLFSALAGRLLELMVTLEEAGTARMEQRVARHLLRRAGPDGVLRSTQAGIASDLGTAREVVFRALRSLAARGIVRTGRARVAIVDPAKLRALASAR